MVKKLKLLMRYLIFNKILDYPKKIMHILVLFYLLFYAFNSLQKTNVGFLPYAIFNKTCFDNNLGCSCFHIIC